MDKKPRKLFCPINLAWIWLQFPTTFSNLVFLDSGLFQDLFLLVGKELLSQLDLGLRGSLECDIYELLTNFRL